MTNGSTYAANPSSPSPVKAIIKEIVAARSKILASRSSNYSLIFSHNDSSSSSSSLFGPFYSSLFYASSVESPLTRFVWNF